MVVILFHQIFPGTTALAGFGFINQLDLAYNLFPIHPIVNYCGLG